MSQGLSLRFRAPGPVGGAYLADRSPVSAIMGPVGSAKTSCSIWKLVYIAAEQHASPVDGVRRFKAAIVRDTYKNLVGTTIPSWHRWFPKDIGAWSNESPMSHRIAFDVRGVGPVDLLVEFIALDGDTIEDKMRGWEGNAVYLNEADLLDERALTYALSRVEADRYPGGQHGRSRWNGVLLDFNAPDVDNWIYQRFVEDLPKGWKFYVQPSGLSADAENLANLAPGYYQRQAASQPEWFVRRFIKNLFGYSRDGKPVYPEFNDALMVPAEPIQPVRGLALLIGADAGGTPAAAIRQHLPNGQRRVIDEVISADADFTGPERFGEALNRLLAERYAGWPADLIRGYGDPAAQWGVDRQRGDRSWLEILSKTVGVTFRPAPTNDPTLRIEAVRAPMTKLIDGGTPAFLMSPRCRVLRKAYNSGYRLRRIAAAGAMRFDDKPEKNRYSHVADADQYAALGDGEHLAALGRRSQFDNRPRQIRAADDERPFGEFAEPTRSSARVIVDD